MAEMRPDLIMPDERAAGVISGSDPYRELELYLEKVNEEFGEVFERWLGSSDQTTIKQNGSLKSMQLPPSADAPKNFCNGNQGGGKPKEIIPLPVTDIHELYLNSYRTRSLPIKSKTQNGGHIRRLNNIYAYASEKAKAVEKEWSDGLMAEFDKLIAMELNQLRIDTEKIQETRLEAKDLSTSPSVDSSESTGSSLGSFRKNLRSFKRSLSDGPNEDRKNGKQNGNAVLLRVSPLGEDSPRRCSDSQLPPRRPKRIPSPVRIKEFFRSTSPFGKRGKKEIAKEKQKDDGSYKNTKCFTQGPNIPPAAPPKRKKNNNSERKIPIGLQNFLTKIRPSGTRSRSESPGETTSGFNTMDSSTTELEDSLDAILSSVSTATQTSPALSRSSSFTWMSDCSSSIILNTPGSLSDVNDEKSSSSERSSSSPARLQCENGCGSECDCDTSGSRDSSGESPDSGDLPHDTKERQKLTRKETWEKIRRRHSELLRLGRKSYSGDVDVWVRRESVHTQTQNEPDTDRETADEDAGDSNLLKWLEIDRAEEKTQGLPPRPRNHPGETNARSLPLEKGRNSRPQHLPLVPLTIRSLPSPTEEEDQPSSPSTASLKLLGATLAPELGNKSSSAPVIMKQNMAMKKDFVKPEEDTKKLILKQPRSQSERHLAEIEAAEACKWLRAAGFPQYAQMYEDLQFPIDVSGVQKDHPFLDKDSFQSLFRRLHALNRCAKMKIDNPPKNSMDDSDEDDQCALSENWTFQPESRRWSRVCDVTNHHSERLHNTGSSNTSEDKPDSSLDSDRLVSSGEDLIGPDDVPVIESLRYGSLPQGAISADSELITVRFRRTNSERLRDSAKAILRRMESLKSRRRKKQAVENITISEPQVLDLPSMQQKMKDLNCVDVSPTATSGSSPEHSSPSPFHLPPSCQYLSPPFADDSSSYCSDNSQGTPVHQRTKSKLHRAKKFFHQSRKGEESGAFSDSEIQPTSWKHRYFKDANSNHAKMVTYIDGRPRGPKDQEPPESSRTPSRGGSLNLGKESQRYREQVQANFRRKGAKLYMDKSGSSELTEDSSSTFASQVDSDQDAIDITTKQRVTVVRWHSFQRGSSRPDSYYLSSDSNIPLEYRSMSGLSCGQLLVLKKMALLKLTACMEKYCPTHRTGWNWELPKFIRKIKAPDYKDKTVFGVPLLLSLQRSGQALPKCIQLALRWLRMNALDQVGLFRKSGVRSRIQTLKAMTENQGEMISYDGHQAYDVADMVKQYFRELPEALLTNKLSETFISIFQHVPETFLGEAVQWALLLLPDEHREALQTVLEFFNQVSARSTCNQMTASNLAVCLAPSLFHLHHPSAGSQSRSTSASPRRRKTVGVPDQRELGENRAAHDCLLYLMKEHKDVFTVSEEMFANCRFSTMDYSIPMTLEQLGSELPDGWRGYLRESISSFLREAKEKSRGWVSVPCSLDNLTEMAYKKVGDGHPLRLWKVWTEVEAPPQELVRRVLRERHLWDLSLLKWRVVAKLDAQVEIFQFVCGSMPPLPAKDYCVLRSWKTDLSKGACVIVETSVEHPDATVLMGGVRGVVLASRYLIEPCGSGKSRIVHLSRVDTKGRSPEWYNKSYGHICAMHLSRIRTSFKHNTDGPESKVSADITARKWFVTTSTLTPQHFSNVTIPLHVEFTIARGNPRSGFSLVEIYDTRPGEKLTKVLGRWRTDGEEFDLQTTPDLFKRRRNLRRATIKVVSPKADSCEGTSFTVGIASIVWCIHQKLWGVMAEMLNATTDIQVVPNLTPDAIRNTDAELTFRSAHLNVVDLNTRDYVWPIFKVKLVKYKM